MSTVEKLQHRFGSKSIIIIMNKLSESELKSLLLEDNVESISAIIDNLIVCKVVEVLNVNK